MPIYAYKCGACGHQQDVLQKISDAALTQCPECGAPAFSKQLTAAGFQLKGSGWYATDFRNGAAPKKADAALEAGKDPGKTPGKDGKESDKGADGAAAAAAKSEGGKPAGDADRASGGEKSVAKAAEAPATKTGTSAAAPPPAVP